MESRVESGPVLKKVIDVTDARDAIFIIVVIIINLVEEILRHCFSG